MGWPLIEGKQKDHREFQKKVVLNSDYKENKIFKKIVSNSDYKKKQVSYSQCFLLVSTHICFV